MPRELRGLPVAYCPSFCKNLCGVHTILRFYDRSSVLGARRNLISWMTGVSHNKLQVLHQGIAFVVGESHSGVRQLALNAFTVYTSLVHGVSAIVQSLM